MEWVLAAERRYVAAATGGPAHRATTPRELAAAGAVASRYLAVGTPRSFAIIGDGAESLEAHRTWFQPRDIRCTTAAVAAATGGRMVPLDEALAADIVCVHHSIALAAGQLRRGSHVNALAPIKLDADLAGLAKRYDEAKHLPALAAGLIDGRQLDEITIFELA